MSVSESVVSVPYSKFEKEEISTAFLPQLGISSKHSTKAKGKKESNDICQDLDASFVEEILKERGLG